MLTGYQHFCNSKQPIVEFDKCWHIFLDLGSITDSLEVQEKKNKVPVLCSRLPQNVKLGIFTTQSCCNDKEIVQKT